MSRCALCIVGMVAWSAGAMAQSEDFLQSAVNSAPPVVSSSQRFVFRGFQSEDGLKLSVWSEKMAGKLEQQVGASLPFRRGEMIRFSAWGDAAAEDGSIRLGQEVRDDLLQQRIGLENPQYVEEEQLLESFMAVLLYRYVVEEFRASGGREAPVVPDWFSVGVAQSLEPSFRNRNLRYVVDEWQSDRGYRVAEILEWTSLPAGRVAKKAYCGMLVDWFKNPLRERLGWIGVLKHLAAGKAMDATWVQNELLDLPSARDMEKAWDLYLAAESNVNRNLGSLSFDQVLQLNRILSKFVKAEDSSGQVRPVEVQLRDLIVARDEVWVARVAERLNRDLSEFAVGQPPQILAVVKEYQTFFTALHSPELLDTTFRFTFGGREAVLHRLLKSATDAMAKLEKEVVVRGMYMDRAARPAPPPAMPEPPAVQVPPAPRVQPDPEPPAAAEMTLEERRRAFLRAIESNRD